MKSVRVEASRVSPDPVNIVDSLRASVAGNGAVAVSAASATLFDAAGKHVLDAGTRRAVQSIVARGATAALAAEAPFVAAGQVVQSFTTRELATVAAGQAARVAAREVLRGAGRAAGVGFVIDGAFASVEAIVAVRSGGADRVKAVGHVAKEAISGALATGAGVLVGAGLVALTGGVATPVVFAVGALSSIGVKRVTRRAFG